ncbi:MAG TPA: hypothetical protein VFT22_38985 [Kofleriaceae bacterium]|nr:hypothetical protein [Kofleriaceae bacterium]
MRLTALDRPPGDLATPAATHTGSAPGEDRENTGSARLVSRVQSVSSMDKGNELRDRIEARKHQLLSKYNELKADTRHEAAEARTRIKARLDELELHLKGGWTKVSDDVRLKLDRWLERRDD